MSIRATSLIKNKITRSFILIEQSLSTLHLFIQMKLLVILFLNIIYIQVKRKKKKNIENYQSVLQVEFNIISNHQLVDIRTVFRIMEKYFINNVSTFNESICFLQ